MTIEKRNGTLELMEIEQKKSNVRKLLLHCLVLFQKTAM